jgi:arsenite-transporting ATPase
VEGIDNLFAIEIDPKRSLENEDFFQNREVFGETQSSSIHQLVSQVPGIDEAIVFMNLLKLAQNMDVEVVIFDTAPTGHTLKMLSFPKVIE